VLSGRERDHVLKEFAPLFKIFPRGKSLFQDLLLKPIDLLFKHHSLWLGISTCLAAGFVEETDSVWNFTCKWWVLVTRTFLHSGLYTASKLWKQYAKRVFDVYTGNELSSRSNPDWSPYPEFPKETWCDKEPNEMERLDFVLLSSFCSTRLLPAGDQQAKDISLTKHEATLLEPPTSVSKRVHRSRYERCGGRASPLRGGWQENRA